MIHTYNHIIKFIIHFIFISYSLNAFADVDISTGVGDVIIPAGGGVATAANGVTRNGQINAINGNGYWTLNNLGTITATGKSSVLLVDSNGSAVNNYGIISTDNRGGVVLTGIVNNHGTISAADFAVSVGLNTEVNNYGTITASMDTVYFHDNAILNNYDSIYGSSGKAVFCWKGGIINNNGSITSGGPYTVYITDKGGEIINNGTISSPHNWVVYFDEVGKVINNETISTTALWALVMNKGGELINNGLISSDLFAVNLLNNHSTLVNNGRIKARVSAVGLTSGIITNHGTITVDETVAVSVGSNAIVTNYGTISATEDGIISNGSNVEIINRGKIIATNNYGIRTNFGHTFITNSGKIFGGSTSILTASGNDTLTLQIGSELNGKVDLAGGNDSLTLEGHGSEDEQFLNIETLNINADSQGWTLSHNNLSFDTVNMNSGLFYIEETLTAIDVNVNAGTIDVDGKLNADSLYIANGASVCGTGEINANLTTQGIIFPGNSIGSLKVYGHYRQLSKGTLFMEIESDKADYLYVSGSATLDGKLQLSFDNIARTTYSFKHVLIQANSGVNGSFDSLEGDLNTAILSSDIIYNQSNVTLKYERKKYIDLAQTSNQRSIASGLDNVSAIADGYLLNYLSMVDYLSTDSEVRTFYDSLIPNTNLTASLGTCDEWTKLINIMHKNNQSHLVNTTNKFSTWAELSSGTKTYDNNFDNPEIKHEYSGLISGINYQINDIIFIGGAFSLIDDKLEEKHYKNKSDSQNVGSWIFGNYKKNNISMNLTLGYGKVDYEQERVLENLNWPLTNEHDGKIYALSFETEYKIYNENQFIKPLVGLDYIKVKEDQYREQFQETFYLDYKKQDTEYLQSKIGITTGKVFNKNNNKFIPQLSLIWTHQFKADSNNAEYKLNNMSSYGKLNKRELAENKGILEINLYYIYGEKWKFNTAIDYQISDNDIAKEYNGKIGVNYLL